MSFVSNYSQNHVQPQIIISVHPRHAENILSGKKTVEFRRRFPRGAHLEGTTVWIYSTSPTKAVIGFAKVKNIMHMSVKELWSNYRYDGGVKRRDFDLYFDGTTNGYAIVLTSVTSLSERIYADELNSVGFNIPQSYRYVTKDISSLLDEASGENPSRHKHRNQIGRSPSG